jgi:hypothetical protein
MVGGWESTFIGMQGTLSLSFYIDERRNKALASLLITGLPTVTSTFKRAPYRTLKWIL